MADEVMPNWRLAEQRAKAAAMGIRHDVDLVEEAVRETILELYRHPEIWSEPEDRFIGWVTVTAMNKMRDLLDKQNRALRRQADNPEALEQAPGVSYHDPTGTRAIAEVLEDLSYRVLTPPQAKVWCLKRLGFSDAEIADQLGLTPQSVRTKLYEIRQRIRSRLPIQRQEED